MTLYVKAWFKRNQETGLNPYGEGTYMMSSAFTYAKGVHRASTLAR